MSASPPDAADRGGKPAATAPVLRIEGLVKRFGSRTVLDGIDLQVGEHEVVVLIGASGSGKSTLLRCVNLLEVVDDGIITLDGVDITDPRVDADSVRRRVGVVFQSYNLFPHMSVLDNITLALRRVHRTPKAAAKQRAQELLARVGLADKAAEFPDRLSGGQQQRTAIARALASSPRLLLLDEVTSALDPELVAEVLELVGELKQDGMTIVMATHEMGFAREAADRVCFLDGGRVVEQGGPADVLERPTHPRTRDFLARVIGAGRPAEPFPD